MQSEGKTILIYSYFVEFRVFFHPYYDMSLGFKSLGLVVVLLLIIAPTLVFEKDFIYRHTLALMLMLLSRALGI